MLAPVGGVGGSPAKLFVIPELDSFVSSSWKLLSSWKFLESFELLETVISFNDVSAFLTFRNTLHEFWLGKSIPFYFSNLSSCEKVTDSWSPFTNQNIIIYEFRMKGKCSLWLWAFTNMCKGFITSVYSKGTFTGVCLQKIGHRLQKIGHRIIFEV